MPKATDWPTRPSIPSVRLGELYQYQGGNKNLKDRNVRVIALSWPGSSDPEYAHLVHVQVVNKKGQPTETTFGCDPRWLATSGLSPYRQHSNDLSSGSRNIKQATAEPFGLVDAEEQVELLMEGCE